MIGTLVESSDAEAFAPEVLPVIADGTIVMMYAESLLPQLEALARRSARAEGVEVAWVELKQQSGSWVFRVFIERLDGDVGLNECERVSRNLGVLLDVEDPIESSYTLEVSTPGLDRPLRDPADYARFAGKLARLKTKQMLSGRRRFRGRLSGVEEESVLLDEDGVMVRIPLSSIESGRLEVELDQPPLRKSREGV